MIAFVEYMHTNLTSGKGSELLEKKEEAKWRRIRRLT